jgi:hypothetical protein
MLLSPPHKKKERWWEGESALKHKIENVIEKLQSWFHRTHSYDKHRNDNGNIFSYQTKEKSIKTTSQI